jgi:hypothetical protein
MNATLFRSLCAALLCVSGVACGDDPAGGASERDAGNSEDSGQESDAGADADVAAGPLLPLREGNSWEYRVTNNGEVTTKVQTVHALEPVGGTGPNKDKMAFRMVTEKGELDETISWQAAEGDLVVRYREQAFHANTGELELEEHWEPHKLRVDGSPEHLVSGAEWREEYMETKIPADGSPSKTETNRDVWLVDSESEEVTVPAGTFQAIVLQKAGGSTLKTYWYVPGIGKVKETGGQTEELVRYEVTP